MTSSDVTCKFSGDDQDSYLIPHLMQTTEADLFFFEISGDSLLEITNFISHISSPFQPSQRISVVKSVIGNSIDRRFCAFDPIHHTGRLTLIIMLK